MTVFNLPAGGWYEWDGLPTITPEEQQRIAARLPITDINKWPDIWLRICIIICRYRRDIKYGLNTTESRDQRKEQSDLLDELARIIHDAA